ncbi:MAG TPA: substrate-binding domain-containing protein [Pirellulaceae bacterium]|nr:substrate-binding domain-containing protein [Pirellulaceae bacterium]
MSIAQTARNRVKVHRLAKGWSQVELARRAGISRTGVSAIEGVRLVPSVSAALALAGALECPVEELFGQRDAKARQPRWAWPATTFPRRYWQAEVAGQSLLFPLEADAPGAFRHDGVAQSNREPAVPLATDSRTLVLATCDPAAGLLAEEYSRHTGFRLLVIPRSSRQALALLAQGIVHVAGIHLATMDARGGNADSIRRLKLDRSLSILHVASWDEGLALSPARNVASIRAALSPRLHWVGREEGAGARRCQDELLGKRSPPRRIARSHQGIVQAVKNGWADLGICQRMAAQEGGVQFLPVCREAYDLCFRSEEVDEPRIAALIGIIRSAEFRRLLAELPGYRPQSLGQIETVEPKRGRSQHHDS